MDASSPSILHHHHLADPKKRCLPLALSRLRSTTSLWALRAFRNLKSARSPDGFLVRKSAAFWDCPLFREEAAVMESVEATVGEESRADSYSDSAEEECRGSSSTSAASEDSAATLGWPVQKSSVSGLAADSEKTHGNDDAVIQKLKRNASDMELMKERLSKLLLGEDMSGCGKGVCTALAISNAITNLCATIFGQLWRLEPLPPEKKSMWRREMDWLLCISDHIVELMPSWQVFPDGSELEVMTCRPRSDLYINLPALRKLDNMLLEILDGFGEPEFWYIDQGISAPDYDGSASFRRTFHRRDEKWWLPVPRVPLGGLNENTRKQLQHKRDCANQILKAAMAINSNALAEMEVPESFLESLPKNGRASLGDLIYRCITSDQFSPECLLDCLDMSKEHQALEIANRVEASIYVWRQRTLTKPTNNTSRGSSKSSWGIVKEMIMDSERRGVLADRAEGLLHCLKLRFPGLTQTTLDMSKIQFNKDVGKSILESYSRVLESLASNIVARIDDLLYVDDMSKHSDQSLLAAATDGKAVHSKVLISYSVPISGTPFATAHATPCLSSTPLVSPTKGGRTLLIDRRAHDRGLGVKKVLTDYIGAEVEGTTATCHTEIKGKNC